MASSKSDPPRRQLVEGQLARPQDVAHVARALDIHVGREPHLLWIAREALETPLPPGWTYGWIAEEGKEGYQSSATGDIMFRHPADEYFKDKVALWRGKGGGGVSVDRRK